MNQKPLSRLIFFVVFFILTVVGFILFYQHEKSPLNHQPFETHQLLKKIPSNTVAFYSWRADVPSYANLQLKAPLHSTNTWIGQADKLPLSESELRLLHTLLDAVTASGLINKDTGAPDGILEFLGFVKNNGDTPELSFNIISKDTVDLSVLANSLKAALEKEQIPVTQNIQGSQTTLTVDSEPFKLHGIFDRHTASISNVETLPRDFFSSKQENGFHEIVHSPKYQKLLAQEAPVTGQFGLGLADLEILAALAKKSSPDAAAREIDDIPFSVVSLGQYASDRLKTEVLFKLSPKNEQQKLLISNVSRPAQNSLFQRVPADAALTVVLDGQLIRTIEEGAISDLTPEEKQASEEWTKLVDTFDGLALGALSAPRDALVPDLFVTIQSKNAGKLFSIIEEQTRQLISTQIPMANWLDKTIDGVQVKYIITPLGIGLYLTSIKDTFIAASTENAVSALIASANGKSPSAASTNSDLQHSSDAIVQGSMDFRKIAEAIESVQGSLSLFTGGSSNLNADQIQDLKRLGNASFNASVSNELLKLEWNLKPSA